MGSKLVSDSFVSFGEDKGKLFLFCAQHIASVFGSFQDRPVQEFAVPDTVGKNPRRRRQRSRRIDTKQHIMLSSMPARLETTDRVTR